MSSIGNKFALPEKYVRSTITVWAEFGKLALEVKPINLGQGFPDYAAPKLLRNALRDVANSDDVFIHQYSRNFGHIRLVNALSKLYSRNIGRKLNPMTNFIITAGAYEALYSAICGHVTTNDEVILIEPFFDCYQAMVDAAGGKSVFVPIRPTKTTGKVLSGDWKLDINELTSCFTEKTKAIIINNPHNPLGKVFSYKELSTIADLCKKFNVLCISDEVYEWMVYEPNKHISIATLPGMWERTITIGSAGKTFCVTGWKTGWAYGPENFIKNMQAVHINILNSMITPVQEAIAICLEHEINRIDSSDCYFASLAHDLKVKRDFLAKVLTEIGMVPIIPDGGFFMVVDWTPLASKAGLDEESDRYKDYRFAKWTSKNLKVQGLPTSAFYSELHKNLGENYVRYCFIKKDENLHKAAEILTSWAKE